MTQCIHWNELEVNKYAELAKSCYGPIGQVILLQNSVCGPVSATRYFKKAITKYEAKGPITKLMVSAVTNHASTNNDGSCFLATYLAELLKLIWETSLPPRLCCNVLSWCAKQTSEILTGLIHKQLDINVSSIKTHIQGMLQSKLLTYLNMNELDLLAIQVVEIFIRMGGQIQENFVEFTRSSSCSFKSDLHHGVMLDSHHSTILLSPGTYQVVFFECSLSGDTNDVEGYMYSCANPNLISQSIVDGFSELGSALHHRKVNLVICQKVIHPKLKLILRQNDIKYLERLGASKIVQVIAMTGAESIKDLSDDVNFIQTVSLICSHINKNENTWLLLESVNPSQYVCCLQLYHWSEQVLTDVQECCTQSLKCTSGLILLHNGLLVGGGTWQLQLKDELMKKALQVTSDYTRSLGATSTSFRLVVNCYTRTLEICAKLVKSADDDETYVGDSYYDYHIALQSAVSVAKTILMIGNVIQTD